MTFVPEVINFEGWLSDNAHLLRPPVSNKQLWMGSEDFIVQVLGGPNNRTDYHVDPYEEFFYQIKGTISVKVMGSEGPNEYRIGPGEMLLIPGNLPHSPQRKEEGSIGLVIERVREEGTLERFQWYCASCFALLHDVEIQVRDIVADLPPVFDAFYSDVDARTCAACGTVHPAIK